MSDNALRDYLASLLTQNPPNSEQLIAMHYELGLSLQTLEKMNIDTTPLRVREYSRTMMELTVLKKIESYHFANTLISDGVRTHSVCYFVFEYVLLSGDVELLDQLLSTFSGEDLSEIMPLLESREQLPDQLIQLQKKEQIDMSNCKLTEAQKQIPDYLPVPTDDLILTIYKQNFCHKWYCWNTLTDTGKRVIDVLIKNTPRRAYYTLIADFNLPHSIAAELVKFK